MPPNSDHGPAGPLERGRDQVDQQELRQQLAARGLPYRATCHARVATTQDLVLAQAAAGAEEGLVVVADYQQAGRGRWGRHWVAPPGSSLMFSLLWRPTHERSLWSTLPLVAGLAVAEGIEAAGGPPITLKWPNDCLVGDRKVAGILMESHPPTSELPPAVVLGVGCNVHWKGKERPRPALGPITALDLEGCPVRLNNLALAVLGQLHVRYSQWQAFGFSALQTEWEKRAAWRGQQVVVQLPRALLRGVIAGIGPDGSLRLRTAEGIVAVAAGELSRGLAPGLRLSPAAQWK